MKTINNNLRDATGKRLEACQPFADQVIIFCLYRNGERVKLDTFTMVEYIDIIAAGYDNADGERVINW